MLLVGTTNDQCKLKATWRIAGRLSLWQHGLTYNFENCRVTDFLARQSHGPFLQNIRCFHVVPANFLPHKHINKILNTD